MVYDRYWKSTVMLREIAMQTSSDLSDRLSQRLQDLSPLLQPMVLEFVEFLLKQQQVLKDLSEVSDRLEENGQKQDPVTEKHPLLQFAGAWQGDDGPACLEMVYATRSRIAIPEDLDKDEV